MLIDFILNHLFPAKCPVCDGLSDEWEISPFCSRCWSDIKPYTGHRCSLCGRPAESAETSLCSDCIDKRPFYDGVLYYGLFEGTLREALHHFKYTPLRRMAGPLVRLIEDVFINVEADLITPVPLHKKRLLERGFNQSALLSKLYAKAKGLHFEPYLLRKKENNRPQSQMKKTERTKNVHNIFDVTCNVGDKKIILFDDVVTTGATVSECARLLKSKGAEQVRVVAIARACDSPQFTKEDQNTAEVLGLRTQLP